MPQALNRASGRKDKWMGETLMQSWSIGTPLLARYYRRCRPTWRADAVAFGRR